MNHIIAIAFFVLATVCSAIAGQQLADAAATGTDPLAGWGGIATFLAFGGGAMTWLVVRLGKSDDQATKRTDRYESLIQEIVANNVATRMVIEQNSKLLERVEDAMTECQRRKQP